LLTAFAFVGSLDLMVLIVRVVGMVADNSVSENIPLVRAELLLLFLAAVGVLIELFRKRRVVAPQSHQ
jgi:hypothetical protein